MCSLKTTAQVSRVIYLSLGKLYPHKSTPQASIDTDEFTGSQLGLIGSLRVAQHGHSPANVGLCHSAAERISQQGVTSWAALIGLDKSTPIALTELLANFSLRRQKIILGYRSLEPCGRPLKSLKSGPRLHEGPMMPIASGHGDLDRLM